MKFPGKRLIVEYKNRRSHKSANSLWGDINLKEIAREVDDEQSLPEKTAQPGSEEKLTDCQNGVADDVRTPPTQIDQPSITSQENVTVERPTPIEPLPDNDIKPPAVKAKHRERPRSRKYVQRSNERARLETKHDAGEQPTAAQDVDRLPFVSGALASSLGSSEPKTIAPVKSQKQSVIKSVVPSPAPKTQFEKVRRPMPLVPHPTAELNSPLILQDPELSSLEAENKRLKSLLVEHLRAENERLKQMMLRADQVFDETDDYS